MKQFCSETQRQWSRHHRSKCETSRWAKQAGAGAPDRVSSVYEDRPTRIYDASTRPKCRYLGAILFIHFGDKTQLFRETVEIHIETRLRSLDCRLSAIDVESHCEQCKPIKPGGLPESEYPNSPGFALWPDSIF